MKKIGKHEGRLAMTRSEKPLVMRVEKKKEPSKEEQARLKYLGNLNELFDPQ